MPKDVYFHSSLRHISDPNFFESFIALMLAAHRVHPGVPLITALGAKSKTLVRTSQEAESLVSSLPGASVHTGSSLGGPRRSAGACLTLPVLSDTQGEIPGESRRKVAPVSLRSG